MEQKYVLGEPMPKLKTGQVYLAEVTEVKEGKLGEFVAQERLVKWKNANPQQPTLQVHVRVDLPDGKSVKAKRELQIHKDDQGRIQYGSNLGRFIRTNKGAPEVGMKVSVIGNEDGFPEFALVE